MSILNHAGLEYWTLKNMQVYWNIKLFPRQEAKETLHMEFHYSSLQIPLFKDFNDQYHLNLHAFDNP